MASVRGKFPKIVWNGNTILFGVPLDQAVAFSRPSPGSERARAASGVRDAWLTGIDQILRGAVRWIPGEDETCPYGHTATGWDGATGWRAFLEYAWEGNAFAFYPDKDVGTNYVMYLNKPDEEPPTLEESPYRRLDVFELEDADGTVIVGY